MSYWDDDVVKSFTGFFQEDAVTSSDVVGTSTTASKQVRRRPDRFEGQVRRRPDRFEGQVRRHPQFGETIYLDQTHKYTHPGKEAPPPITIHEHAHNSWLKEVSRLQNFIKYAATSGILGTENIPLPHHQVKYGRFAEAAYKHHSGEDVDAFMKEHPGTSGFFKDIELSISKNSLVLHNPFTGETVLSFRGTAGSPIDAPLDWWTNFRTGGISGGRTTAWFKDGEAAFERAAAKYGTSLLTLTGHSQGGNIASVIGLKNDVETVIYDGAISLRTAGEHLWGNYAKNISKLIHYRPHTGVVSGLALSIRRARNVIERNYNTLVGNDTHVADVHSTTNIWKEGVRNTKAASIAKGLGDYVNVGLQAYFTEQDLKADDKIKNKGDRDGAKETDVAKGVATLSGQILAGDAIMAGMAAVDAPMFLAGALAIGAGVGVSMAADAVAEEAKKNKFMKHVTYGKWGSLNSRLLDSSQHYHTGRKEKVKDQGVDSEGEYFYIDGVKYRKARTKHHGFSISDFFKHGF